MTHCKALTVNNRQKKRESPAEDFYFEQKFTSKDYNVCHFTSHKNLVKILKSKKISSICESRIKIEDTNFGLEGDDLYNESIFVSVIFPYISKNKGINVIKHTFYPSGIDKVYLIFKSKILKKCHHWCNKWNFGDIDENCILYDEEQSLNENLNLWNCIMKNKIELFIRNQKIREEGKIPSFKDGGSSLIFGIPENEAIFYENISLDDLEYIYIDSSSFTKKQMKIIKLYPEYNWVTSNPFE
jgi:hypothetical protein